MRGYVNFSHDGLRDSLTYLAAPPLFYEYLRRELAAAHRNRTELTLLQFNIVPQVSDVGSIYEVAILNFSQLLKNEIRSEDMCARLGRFEFTLILRTSLDAARQVAQRVRNSWHDENFLCTTGVVIAKKDESPLEFLNRLDHEVQK